MVETARRLDIFEILEQVAETKSRPDKLGKLKQYDCPALRDVLRGYYDDRVQWLLPEGCPPFRANLPESVPSTLLKQHMKFKYFVKSPFADQILGPKRENIFIGVLESVHPADAKVLVDMINKKPIKGVTKKLCKEAFPDLIT